MRHLRLHTDDILLIVALAGVDRKFLSQGLILVVVVERIHFLTNIMVDLRLARHDHVFHRYYRLPNWLLVIFVCLESFKLPSLQLN